MDLCRARGGCEGDAGGLIAAFPLYESSLRTQGPIRRGLSFRHWSKGLSSLLRPGVMGPCVRRDDPLRELELVICDNPARKREREQEASRVNSRHDPSFAAD